MVDVVVPFCGFMAHYRPGPLRGSICGEHPRWAVPSFKFLRLPPRIHGAISPGPIIPQSPLWPW